MQLSKLAQCLIDEKLLSANRAFDAFSKAKSTKTHFIVYLIKHKLLDSEIIFQCAKKYSGLETCTQVDIDHELLENNFFNRELLHHYHALPLRQEKNKLYVGVSDPFDDQAINALSFQTGLQINLLLMPETMLAEYLQRFFSTDHLQIQLKNSHEEKKLKNDEIKMSHFENENNEEVMSFVDNIIKDAIDKQASDIHIEPYESSIRIRLRCDGLLLERTTVPKKFGLQMVSRIKIMSQMNIAEKRLPQDGQFILATPNKNDIRVSTCPSFFGEKVVLRLLNASQSTLQLTALGLLAQQQNIFYQQLKEPSGLILVVGPTGSGKTITLYAALNHLKDDSKSIMTVEDPVEIQLPGITQININPLIGFDYPEALRAFLRQDPDIIMIGEIRDTKTAKIALQAAQTGHLVLATMHANHTIQALERLMALTTSSHLILNTLNLIVAQRLVKLLCTECNIATDYRCGKCRDGFKGRTGIFEFLTLDKNNAATITNATQLKSQYQVLDNITLWQAGLIKIKNNLTNLLELTRTLGTNDRNSINNLI